MYGARRAQSINARGLFFQRKHQDTRLALLIVMLALALWQLFDSAVFKSELVEPIESLCRKQEQLLVTLHASKRNQVTHNRFADARLAVVRTDSNASDFGHAVFERVERTAAMDAIVNAVDNIIIKLFRNGILRTRHEIALRNVVLHDAEDIRDVFDCRRTNAGVLVSIHHGSVTAGREHFLQHTALKFTAQQMHTVRASFACMNGVHQVIHLRKVEHIGIEFQKFLRLVHIHCRNKPVVRRFQVFRILACHKTFELDAAFTSNKEQLPDFKVLAKFSSKFRTRNVVGATNLVPANRRDNRHKLLVHELFQEVALDALDAAGAHVIDTVNHAHAARQNPVALDAAEAARREVAHDALSHSQRRLLHKRERLFVRESYAVMKFRLKVPGLELSVDAISRTRHDNDANARLVQKGDITHQHGEHRMVHQAVVNLQDEKLALEPIHVAKHFPDESGHFEVLRIKIGRCVIHVLKSSNRKSEGQKILRHLNKNSAFLLRRENLQQLHLEHEE